MLLVVGRKPTIAPGNVTVPCGRGIGAVENHVEAAVRGGEGNGGSEFEAAQQHQRERRAEGVSSGG